MRTIGVFLGVVILCVIVVIAWLHLVGVVLVVTIWSVMHSATRHRDGRWMSVAEGFLFFCYVLVFVGVSALLALLFPRGETLIHPHDFSEHIHVGPT